MESSDELIKCWGLIGRAIPLMHIMPDNDQAREWLKDVKRYLNHGPDGDRHDS